MYTFWTKHCDLTESLAARLNDYDQAHEYTAISLQQVMDSTERAELSQLSLPERNELVDEIARAIPAGNVPSMVAAGLMRAPGRIVSENDNRRNLSLLMQGMQTILDKVAFQTFFAGPTAVLTAYQKILKLAGKDPDQSFPNGTWQFYVEFGLREDSGRHACETNGFQTALANDALRPDAAEELASWLAASAWLLHRYDALLENEWREHVQIRHFATVTGDDALYAQWVVVRPFHVPVHVADDYPDYRRARFEAFYRAALDRLDRRIRRRVEEGWEAPAAHAKRASDLAAYLRQMTIHAILTPEDFSDVRTPITPANLALGVIADNRYYAISAFRGGFPLVVEDARQLAYAILRPRRETPAAELDRLLATAHRTDQPALRRLLDEEVKGDLAALRNAPILINWDRADATKPLAQIRAGRRGIGDHAITIFRTGQSMVFDLSHIFFDGTWGLAVAEIITARAIHEARHLAEIPDATYASVPIRALNLSASSDLKRIAREKQIPSSVSAEATLAHLEHVQKMRRLLRQRNTTMKLSVNDILILFRSLFGQLYVPSSALNAALNAFEISGDDKGRRAVALARTSIELAQQLNPSLLIPMDAARVDPRERVFPTTFRNPLPAILTLHRTALDALQAYHRAGPLRSRVAWGTFSRARADYLATVVAFEDVFSVYKTMTLQGESVSTSTIKLLGGMPNNVRRLLNSVPERIDSVNDIVKGQEVFSNVGRVAADSSLQRFNTAKDDNDKKTLAWAIMTDSSSVMHISLRDFRPHVAPLLRLKGGDSLAEQIAQDYVNAFASGLNQFMGEVMRLLLATTNKQSE